MHSLKEQLCQMNGHLVQYKIENHTDTPAFEKKKWYHKTTVSMTRYWLTVTKCVISRPTPCKLPWTRDGRDHSFQLALLSVRHRGKRESISSEHAKCYIRDPVILNSLAPDKYGNDLKCVIFKLIIQTNNWLYRLWLGAITWAQVDPDLHPHMATMR